LNQHASGAVDSDIKSHIAGISIVPHPAGWMECLVL
jgi:hypothetical protein